MNSTTWMRCTHCREIAPHDRKTGLHYVCGITCEEWQKREAALNAKLERAASAVLAAALEAKHG